MRSAGPAGGSWGQAGAGARRAADAEGGAPAQSSSARSARRARTPLPEGRRCGTMAPSLRRIGGGQEALLRSAKISVQGNRMEIDHKRYRAFLSYSQRDRKVARLLHRALETYRVPSGV